MPYAICPNCRSMTPYSAPSAETNCRKCNAPLGRLLQEVEETAVAKQASYSLATTQPSGSRMDPRICESVYRHEAGVLTLGSSSNNPGETAVIARVNDVEAFSKIEGVRFGIAIPPNPDDTDKTTIVTARILREMVKTVRAEKCVVSLKESVRLRPQIEKILDDVGINFDQKNVAKPEPLGRNGQDVIIGIVDFGMDFRHKNFRRRTGEKRGKTRILKLWNQAGDQASLSAPAVKAAGYSTSSVPYGVEYDEEAINQALEGDDLTNLYSEVPYQKLGYTPSADTPSQIGAHGTYVADIAAGNGWGSKIPGLAPEADIIFVDVSSFPGGQHQGDTFGDCAQMIEAVDYIFKAAGDRPCVVNISLGTNDGPHDGLTPVEMAIDRLVGAKPNRAVVVAAGNSYEDRVHAAGVVAEGKQVDLKWRTIAGDPTSNVVEIWYSGDDQFTVELYDPDGHPVCEVETGGEERVQINGAFVYVNNRLHDPNNGDNLIYVSLDPGLPSGDWIIRLHGTRVQKGEFNAWIERDDSGQSQFVETKDKAWKVERQHTIGSLAGGRKTITVGSYDARDNRSPLFEGSGAGPTRDDRQKPEISAPGKMVMAAYSRTLILRNRVSGTSVAAPVVTGVIALMMSEAQEKDRRIDLTADEIRKILIKTARRKPPKGSDWDPRYGHGRVSAKAAVSAVTEMAKEAVKITKRLRPLATKESC